MTEQQLHILFLEDNPADMELATYQLRRAGLIFEAQRVDSEDGFRAALAQPPDVILADYTLPRFSALDALAIMNEAQVSVPFIVVTGTISEEVAVECIKQGASDYLLKDRLTRLPTAIENALDERSLRVEKAMAEDQLRMSELRYRTLVEVSPDAIVVHDNGKLMFVNPATVSLMGAQTASDLIGRNVLEFVHPNYREQVIERIAAIQQGAEHIDPLEEKIIRMDGQILDVEIVGGPLWQQGKLYSQLVVRDITARKRRERELRAIAALSEALRLSTSEQGIVHVLLQQARYLLDALAAMLFLRKPAGDQWEGIAGLGLWEDVSGMMVRPGGPTEQVLTMGEARLFNDIGQMDDDTRRALDDGSLEGIHSLICLPLQTEGDVIGALWLGSDRQFDQDDIDLLEALSKLAATGIKAAFLRDEIETDFLETVLALANTLDVRDTQTADHSQKMAVWAERTAVAMGAKGSDRRVVRLAALLHDIGKIGVPDKILMKGGPLTDEERAIMERHPDIGAEIVAPVSKLADVAPIIRAHQERYDGKGYPLGLKGEEIPLMARVLTVVDAYAAMTEDRVYRAALSQEEAVQELINCKGKYFDPDVVDVFLTVLGERS